jgi:hypothetical protein
MPILSDVSPIMAKPFAKFEEIHLYLPDSDSEQIQHQFPLDDVILCFQALGILNYQIAVFLIGEIGNIGTGPFNYFPVIALGGNEFVFHLPL